MGERKMLSFYFDDGLFFIGVVWQELQISSFENLK